MTVEELLERLNFQLEIGNLKLDSEISIYNEIYDQSSEVISSFFDEDGFNLVIKEYI